MGAYQYTLQTNWALLGPLRLEAKKEPYNFPCPTSFALAELTACS